MSETFIIVMPTYNEEEYIEETVLSWAKLISSFPGSEILVINDGSTDGTKEKLNNLSKEIKGLAVIHKQNEGHGKTILLGYKKALQTPHTWVFQTDSDGHFSPTDYYMLWEKRANSDFVLGQRYKRKDSFDRIVITKLAQLWILILFGEYIKDPNIPFRLMRKKYLKKILKRVPKGVFAPNIFLSILAKKDGHNLHNIPVAHKPRKQGKQNKPKLLKGVFKSFAELTLFALSLI